MASLFGAFLLLPGAPRSLAAGGDGPEAMTMGNMCMVMFGYEMIHITAYQPGASHSEFCEEFPSTGKTILVFDLASPSFRDLPIEVRIIRDPLTPVAAGADLGPLTEVLRPFQTYKTGTFNFEHDFKENGHYIGMVTIQRPNGAKESAQFKFMVGQTLWKYVSPFLGVILVGLMVAAYWKHNNPGPKVAPAMDA
ncbi:MAG: hypothetical protein HYS06_04805 [Methylocystis sp.]|nr:hypothetical protein [Methylocystis sp.]